MLHSDFTLYHPRYTIHLKPYPPFLSLITNVTTKTTTFQVNFCTYYSKGVSDYVAIWDFDEFFIPRGKNKNLIDLVDSTHAPAPLDIEIANTYAKANTNNELWKGGPGPGWANGNGHPYCFIQIL